MTFDPALFLVLGVVFGGLASPIAYLLFYREYIHHFPHEQARALALKATLIAFGFFVGLSVIVGFFITRFIVPQ